jgi:hypothetical protein
MSLFKANDDFLVADFFVFYVSSLFLLLTVKGTQSDFDCEQGSDVRDVFFSMTSFALFISGSFFVFMDSTLIPLYVPTIRPTMDARASIVGQMS